MIRWLVYLHTNRQRFVGTLVCIVTLIALAGLARVEFEDDPRAVFRVDDPQFAELDQFYDEFGAHDQDILLVIDGDELFTPARILALRSTCTALSQLAEVESVLSLLDLRKSGPIPLSLLPLGGTDEVTVELVDRARANALNHEVAKHLLAPDAKLTLVSVRLRGRDPKISELPQQVDQVRRTAEQHLSPVDLRVRAAGHPSIRIDLLNTMRAELLKFALLSTIVSAAIGLAIFRTPLAVAIAVAGPAVGVIWTLGAMGWLQVRIDPLSVILPTLLFVVGFTDSVHLVLHMQVTRDQGESRVAAAVDAVRHLGPACLLTAITTMAGFGSLLVARLDSVQHFGGICAAGTLVMFCAVQLVVPMLASTKLGEGLVSRVGVDGNLFFTRLLTPAYRQMLRVPRTVALLSVAVTLFCFYISLGLNCDQRWTESLSESSETRVVTAECDQVFGGTMHAYVTVQWPEGQQLASSEALQVLQEVHSITAGANHLGEPMSVLSILKSTRRPQGELSDQVRHLRRAPASLIGRMVQEVQRKAVVSIPVPDIGAAQLGPEFDRLEQRLDAIRAAHPAYELRLTGTDVVASRNVHQMILDLVWSLSVASFLIFLVITSMFRSFAFGLLSIIPNILPQTITACVLIWLQESLTMASVLTFSLCLGLSVDDTVHFLMRYRSEREGGLSPQAAVFRSFQAVGGVMITTSLVLIGGFLVTLASSMPAVRAFSGLCCVTLLAAIVGDLIMLPTLIVSFFTPWHGGQLLLVTPERSQDSDQRLPAEDESLTV